MAAETRIIVSAKDLFSDVFHRAELGVESLARTVEKFEDLVPFAGLGMGAYIGKEALRGLTQETFEYMDHMGKLAQQVGMTTEELTRYGYVAKIADVDQESFIKSVERLEKNMGGAAGGISEGMDSLSTGGNKVRAALMAMGYSQQQIRAGMQDMPSFLASLAEKFAGYENGAQKTALAMTLFGKSGAAMIPWLNKGGEAMRGLMADADALGVVISEETAQKAEEVNDEFKRLKAQFEGVRNAVAAGLLPTFQNLAETFVDHKAKVGDYSTTIDILSGGIKGLAQSVLFLKSSLVTSAEGWGMLKDMATKNGGPELWAAIDKRREAIEREWRDFNESTAKLDLFGEHPKEEQSGEHASPSKKTQAPLVDMGKNGGLETITKLGQEAYKAEEQLTAVKNSYQEFLLTLSGDPFGAALLKNQAEYDKASLETLKEYQKIQDERKALAAKGRLTPQASALLDRQQAAVLARTFIQPQVQTVKDALAQIQDDLETMAHDAAHVTTMAESTGIGQWEAKANAIKAKYDALRKDPKTMRFSADWDAEQGAALLRLERDKAVAMAQQRSELAQLVGDTHGYYGEQIKILEIQRDQVSTDEERRLIQEKLNRAQAQFAGDGMDGLRRSLGDFAADAEDTWKNWYEAGRASISKIEDALADLSVGKEVDFQKFSQDFAREVSRDIVIRPMLGQLTNALTSIPGLQDIFGAGKDAALTAASASLDASAVSLDASAIGLDTAALSLETAAITLEGAALSMGASSAGSIAQSGSEMLSGMVDNFFNLDGARASGGPVGSGDYLVGERGPEILRIGGAGYVYDNAATQDILSGATGAGAWLTQHNVTIEQNFDFRGADSSAITQVRAYASVIKRESVAEAMAAIRAESDRGGSYSKSLGRRSK